MMSREHYEYSAPKGAPNPKTGRRKINLGKWVSWFVVFVCAVTFFLEVRAWWIRPLDPELFVSRENEVLIEATPKGEVVVVAEADGQILGKAPLRLLVPQGPKISVLLTAPERKAVRRTLPHQGRLLVRLDPQLPEAPECSVELPADAYWQYQTALGQQPSKIGDLKIKGTAILRIVPSGYGAWLIECSEQDGTIKGDFRRQFPPLVNVHINEPRGALLHLGERPLGVIPKQWTQGQTFAQIRVRSVDGAYVTRWVAAPASIGVRFPSSESSAPALTIPGTRLEDPAPYYLRKNQRR